MADITITASDVQIKSAFTEVTTGVAGEALTQGKVVYQDTDGDWFIADCTDENADAASGVVLIPAAAVGDTFSVAKSGPIDIGGTLTVGAIYVLSESGAIAPAADLTSSDYVTIVGVATAADTIDLDFSVSGAQVP